MHFRAAPKDRYLGPGSSALLLVPGGTRALYGSLQSAWLCVVISALG
jgi:hypothetical protein